MEWNEFLKLYGPMAIGWIAAGYLFLRLSALQDKIMAAFVADTELKSEMKNALNNLTEAVKARP